MLQNVGSMAELSPLAEHVSDDFTISGLFLGSKSSVTLIYLGFF